MYRNLMFVFQFPHSVDIISIFSNAGHSLKYPARNLEQPVWGSTSTLQIITAIILLSSSVVFIPLVITVAKVPVEAREYGGQRAAMFLVLYITFVYFFYVFYSDDS